MPRQARLDIPGQLYHVMSRGIERTAIFLDEEDCTDFKDRIGVWMNKSGGKCLAWCLMPNHFHFLFLRGQRPLSEVMHHVMTGYAVNFNGRHHRAGHLFQNRYKAIICDAEEYLLELVPYIHLNPLRAHMVKDLKALESYKWCGHAAAITGIPDEILNRNALLSHFESNRLTAVQKYWEIMAEKAKEGTQTDLSGGGLTRSFGGTISMLKALRAGQKILSDQRILGQGDFVELVLRTAGEALEKKKETMEEILSDVEIRTGITRQDILRRTRDRGPARARAIYCYLCKERAGVSGKKLMQELNISQSAVSKLISKGRALIDPM